MPYEELIPHRALRPFVDRFWIRSGPVGDEPLCILPDGCIDVLVSEEASVVVGTMTRALVVQPRSSLATVAVRFRPGGATPFLRNCADPLTDERADCGALGASWLRSERIVDMQDLAARVRLLERALLEQLPSVQPPNPLVAQAARLLSGRTPPSVDELARRLGWTRQHVGREFRAHVGIAPKQFSKVARLQRAVAYGRHARVSLAELAIRAGYYDEAHMDRDFRQLVAATPRAILASGSIRPILSPFDEP